MVSRRQPLHIATSDEEILVPLLASRSCHLPGNTWVQDWIQWFQNNHILFGVCLHHRKHPLESWERCLLLTASVSFGLVISNIPITSYLYYNDILDGEHQQDEVVSVTYFGGYTITKGVLLLWTMGGLCHSIFDILVWHIMACSCCHPGGRWGAMRNANRYKDCGSYALIPLIASLLAMAIFMVLLQASSSPSHDQNNDNNNDDKDDEAATTSDIRIDDWRSFSFLSQYAIELALAWFFYFPVVGTIIFSGILGCGGRLPVLGGRPRDVRRVQEGRFGGSANNQSSHYARF